MKKLMAILALALIFASCKKEEKTQESSIIPNSFMGRNVQVQGTVEVGNKKVDVLIWDSGQIDGDIVSLYVNGKEIIANYTLTASKKRLPVTLDNKGYNYILLYAHNEGSLPPNTCAVSLDDGAGEKNLVLSADLKTNGAYNIVVK